MKTGFGAVVTPPAEVVAAPGAVCMPLTVPAGVELVPKPPLANEALTALNSAPLSTPEGGSSPTVAEVDPDDTEAKPEVESAKRLLDVETPPPELSLLPESTRFRSV